jgi:hypothetical protein
MMNLQIDQRLTIYYLVAFTQLVTGFCIIWFFIGHIWFVIAFSGSYCYGYTREFPIIIFIVQYIVGICLFPILHAIIQEFYVT